MKRRVIYTALIGGYDLVHDPEYISDDFDYYCFTDNPNLVTKVWQIIDISKEKGTYPQNKWNRYYKVLPHLFFKDYDESIYIDANITITGDLNEYIDNYCKDYNLVYLKHPSRDCLYDEAETCIKLNKDDSSKIENQIKKYQEQGYPAHNGLIQSNILYRKHNDPELIKLMETWWNEIDNNSCRDQISFNYSLWKTNYKNYNVVNLPYWKTSYWKCSGYHLVSLKEAEDKLAELNVHNYYNSLDSINLRNSYEYKIGKLITYLPRKIRDFIKK